MAHIDNLISSITDPALRSAIQSEYQKVLGTRQFGLVFNAHKPESVLLPAFPIRRGDKVQVVPEGTTDRTQVDDSGVWVVGKVIGNFVEITLKSDPGTRQTIASKRAVVTREFGDPIFPGLRSTGSINRSENRPYSAVINGENYHALQALLYPYEGLVDAIYIDPPFNSGPRDWKYNNNYVDEKDPYRHSKWVSAMDRRLRLAKRLLNPKNSVLICAIDENELHRLTLLIEQIFSASKVQMVSVLINPSGASIIDQFSRLDEQLLFVHIGAARPIRTAIDTTPGVSTIADEAGNAKPFEWEYFQRRGGNSRRQDTKAKFFGVWIEEATGRIVGCGDALPGGLPRSAAPKPPKGCVQQWPVKRDGSEACWQLSDVTFRRYLAEGRIRVGARNKTTGRYGIYFLTSGHMAAIGNGELTVVGEDKFGALIIENSDSIRRTQVGKTLWTNPAYNATSHGSIMLNTLLPDRKFPYPKSLYGVEDALRYYLGNKRSALVLDFFGGSGTTAHAVARLNKQDGGSRRSIIVTNNEVSPGEAETLRKGGFNPGDPSWEALGICKHITIPRLEAAYTGINSVGNVIDVEYKFVDIFPMKEGFQENVEFFDLTYEDPALVSLGRKFKAIAPLLWLKAGSIGERIDEVAESGWAVPDEANYGVLFDTRVWSDFVEAVNKRHEQGRPLVHAFIVTDSGAEYRQIVAKMDATLASTRLYADYLRTFEINTATDD